jgi:uncharacterized membrane protein YedE/YeeE
MGRVEAIVSFVCGVVFAVGLGISGMTRPTKVLGFFDFVGDWDPSLMLVMVGAIGVHVWFARLALDPANKPLLAASFRTPHSTAVDARLVMGAALFGLGWGLAGYCPGPALVSTVTLAPITLAFGGAMVVGLVAGSRLSAPKPARSSAS